MDYKNLKVYPLKPQPLLPLDQSLTLWWTAPFPAPREAFSINCSLSRVIPDLPWASLMHNHWFFKLLQHELLVFWGVSSPERIYPQILSKVYLLCGSVENILGKLHSFRLIRIQHITETCTRLPISLSSSHRAQGKKGMKKGIVTGSFFHSCHELSQKANRWLQIVVSVYLKCNSPFLCLAVIIFWFFHWWRGKEGSWKKNHNKMKNYP